MRSKKLKLMVGALLVTMVGATFVGCGSNESAEGDKAGSGAVTISISGSTSVGPTMEILAEDYQKANEGTTIEVQQVGSSAGITNTIDGTSQIGMSSRDLKDYEKELLNYNTVAKDKIAVIVNQKNPLTDITLYMLKSIYTGGVKNWEDLQ